jgi:hypothetical protein
MSENGDSLRRFAIPSITTIVGGATGSTLCTGIGFALGGPIGGALGFGVGCAGGLIAGAKGGLAINSRIYTEEPKQIEKK